ncbi:MAG: penicillin-binding protein transpeptidase [Lachnospiraceae bacterium]|nr:penicillin-binding protein transpeptidase [Lachnospiraceae bacterium]
MTNLTIQIAKYINVILIALYTYYAFRIFGMSDKIVKDKINGKMKRIIYVFHFISYFVLFISTKNYKVGILYAAELVAIIIITIIYHWIYNNMMPLIWNNMIFMLVIGFVMLTRLSFDKAVKQFAIASATLFLCIIVPIIIDKLKQLRKLGWIYGLLGIGLLTSVLFFGVENYGATNWINVFGITLQPSEIVKLLFVFAIASLLSYRTDFRYVVVVTILAAMHVLILVLEKDLGGALIFFLTYLIMLYVATSQPLYLLSGLVSGIGASLIAYRLFQHVRVRVMAWQDPWTLIDKEGYQISQSLFAIGTGSWFGMGLTKGLPTSIPVVDSDFIFSAISEEMGGVFAFCLMLICVSNYLTFINIALKMKIDFYKLIALGFSTMYIFQVFLSVGGVTKLIPSTGVTLPFISYGGSSLLSSIIMICVFQGLYILNQDGNDDFEKTKGKTRKARKARKASTTGEQR